MLELAHRYGEVVMRISKPGIAAKAKFALIAFVFSVLATLSPRTHAGLHSGPDYDFLIALYISTNGAAWLDKSGWGSGDACQWHGIYCYQDSNPGDNTSRVGQISLAGNNLTGPLPSWSSLTEVIALNLAQNKLTGSIPSLGSLTKLAYLALDGNQLTGPVPSLAGLTNLQDVYFNNNRLTGSVPSLTGLVKLEVFEAPFNQLTGSIPCLQSVGPCASGLTNLASFDLSNNLLTGPIPPLAGMTHLASFIVGRNQLTGAVPPLNGVLLGSLATFSVGDNRLTGALPAAPENLQFADLCPNSFTVAAQPAIDPAWNLASGRVPWWADPYSNNRCDDTFTDNFE
jgi:hypothetical protein